MDNKDKTVENALDDIFGTDFIEIDDTNKNDTLKENDKPLFSEDSFNVNEKENNINQTMDTNIENVGGSFQRDDFNVSTDNSNLNEAIENNYNEEVVEPLFNADNFNIIDSTNNNGGSKNDGSNELNYNENVVNVPALDSITDKPYEPLDGNEVSSNISNNEAINNNYDFNNQINTNLTSYPENNLTLENNETSPNMDALTSKNTIKDDKSFNKKIIIYIALGTILGLIVVFILVNFVFGIEKKELCTSTAEDTGYKYTDEYKITYKKNKINYVETAYTYTALNDEYKDQIQYVSEDKLRAVINSNGMSGFTYTYETSDDYVKVNGYLDFTLFNYDEIEKINQDAMPLSYFKINRDMTYKTLKTNLEKNGYKCTKTK